jgi:hypothetical protein
LRTAEEFLADGRDILLVAHARSEEHLKPEGIQSASCVQALRFTFVATLAS